MSFLDLASQSVKSVGNLRLPDYCDSLDEFDFTIDISNNSIDSLCCHHSALPRELYSLFKQCEVLIAEGNLIRDFCGIADLFPNLIVIDASDNRITDLSVDSLDALSCLPSLDTIILGRNQMTRFTIGSVRGGPLSPIATQLKILDLPENMITRFPDFSQCVSLTTVVLSKNNIAQLSAEMFGKHLPPNVEALHIDDNKIDDWWSLVQLTTVADTLKHFSINGNVFCEQVKFSWRIFIGWLVPDISIVDGEELTTYEIDATVDLFKDDVGQGDILSTSLLSLMDTGREFELEEYLTKHCRVQTRHSHPHRNPISGGVSYADTPEGTSPTRERSLVLSPRNHYRHTPKTSTNESNVNVNRKTSIIESVQQPFQLQSNKYEDPAMTSTVSSAQFLSMSKKLKVIQDIVKVLRQQDMSRRIFASIVLQKHWRGYLCRKYKMTSEDRKRIKLVKSQANRKGNYYDLGFVGPLASKKTPTSTLKEHIGSSSATQERLNKMEETLMSLTVQIQTYGPIIDVIRAKSAKKIQTYYRGYRARKAYKLKKDAYRRYTMKFQAPAVKLQSVARMFLQRKKFLREIAKVREIANLKGTVKVLGGKLSAMERAMEDLISRLETVEQLTLQAIDNDI